jgi:hypothetical protein
MSGTSSSSSSASASSSSSMHPPAALVLPSDAAIAPILRFLEHIQSTRRGAASSSSTTTTTTTSVTAPTLAEMIRWSERPHADSDVSHDHLRCIMRSYERARAHMLIYRHGTSNAVAALDAGLALIHDIELPMLDVPSTTPTVPGPAAPLLEPARALASATDEAMHALVTVMQRATDAFERLAKHSRAYTDAVEAYAKSQARTRAEPLLRTRGVARVAAAADDAALDRMYADFTCTVCTEDFDASTARLVLATCTCTRPALCAPCGTAYVIEELATSATDVGRCPVCREPFASDAPAIVEPPGRRRAKRARAL